MASVGRQVELAKPQIGDNQVKFKSAKSVAGLFPEPIVVPPQLDHQQTFIILHGRGSTAQIFGPPLLDTTTASGEKLQTAFPHAKFIFLTASRNRATIYKRSYTHQWFDYWHMEEPTKRQDLMRAGLKKSCEYVHSILGKEIDIIGKKNVVLWGLSQGCATSLTSLLTWDGEPFAAVIGMCGHLPFANHIEEIAKGGNLEDDNTFGKVGNENFDPFSYSGDEDDKGCHEEGIFINSGSRKKDRQIAAIEFLREEIDMENGVGMVFREIPVFLGHGNEDEKVPIKRGIEAKNCLELVGVDVRMVEYKGLGHWYSAEMLRDIFKFLREKLEVKDK